MAAGDTTQGRRVDKLDEVKEPGDYSVVYAADGSIAALWMNLPDAPVGWARIAGEGHGVKTNESSSAEPEWSIVEEDGVVTVSPSIDCRWGNDESERWHGYLEKGVWREV